MEKRQCLIFTGCITYHLFADQMSAGLHRTWPIADAFVFVENQPIRTRLVMLHLPLADKILFAIIFVTMETDLSLVISAEFLFFLLCCTTSGSQMRRASGL